MLPGTAYVLGVTKLKRLRVWCSLFIRNLFV